VQDLAKAEGTGGPEAEAEGGAEVGVEVGVEAGVEAEVEAGDSGDRFFWVFFFFFSLFPTEVERGGESCGERIAGRELGENPERIQREVEVERGRASY
jgi:hypothetical protein